MADYVYIKDSTGYFLCDGSYYDLVAFGQTTHFPDEYATAAKVVYSWSGNGYTYIYAYDTAGNCTLEQYYAHKDLPGFLSENYGVEVAIEPDPGPIESYGTDYVAVIEESILDVTSDVFDSIGFGLPVMLGLAALFLLISSVWRLLKRTVK